MKIAGDVYKITAGCNVYIILNEDITLIDAGFYGEKDFLKNEIEKIVSLDKIKKVILTHLHYDHCGNVDLFHNALFYASGDEIEDFRKNPKQFFFGGVSDNIKDILLNKLNKIPYEIDGLDVINVPGHTKGSIALVDEKRKLLFSGDTLFNDGIGRYDFLNSVPDKIMESVGKLDNIIKNKRFTLCPGHDY